MWKKLLKKKVEMVKTKTTTTKVISSNTTFMKELIKLLACLRKGQKRHEKYKPY